MIISLNLNLNFNKFKLINKPYWDNTKDKFFIFYYPYVY